MDNPNITMEEYIRLEEEKAHRHGKVYNWETAKYGNIWYDEDIHDLRSVETEFPAIVFNDELSSEKTLFYFLTEATLYPQHSNEFDLKDETSLSEYDEMEQNVLYFNDLFPFNTIHPDDLKSGKDNDDNIDIIQSLGGNVNTQGQKKFMEASNDKINKIFNVESCIMELKVNGYTEEIVHDFEQRLETIFGRQVNRVHILDFEGLTPDMRQDLAERLRMVYTRDDGQEVFVSHTWRRLFEIRAPLVHEILLEFFSTCMIGSEMWLDVTDTLCFQLGGARRSMTWT
ncbi:hypothetical protein Tco_1561225 [Tanacetum coccineum]